METDWNKIGLKCGLEIHQQLNTGKLFCRTPSILREDKPDYTVKRMLRSVASETGQHDRAALEAAEKNKYYIYEGYDDTISLVELDEEPPQKIDKDALETIVEFAMLCKAELIDEITIMRKTVVDGSNTSGFQRTGLVAIGGEIELKNKKLGVQTIVLEEDAARPMEKTDDYIVYRLDRLGIPLIEIATEPGIETPEEAKEAAFAIGSLLRLTGKVKRGLGTIRQDLNVSVKGGARVELKGVQELQILDEYVRREAERQLKLIEIKEELEKRGLKEKDAESNAQELNSVFSKTESKILKQSISNASKNEKIMGIKLEKFAGLLGKEVQKDRRLGTEFAGYVKTKTGLKGLFHSDELPNYGITESEIKEVRKKLSCSEGDAFVIIAGPEAKVKAGIEAVIMRAKQCIIGVPEETRGAKDGGNSEYLRPLPGAARMYPETDLATISLSEKDIKEIRKKLPMGINEREALYKKMGLSERHVNEMKLSNFANLFEKVVKEGADPKKTAVFLLEGLVEARRNGAAIENLTENDIEELIIGIKNGTIQKEIQTKVIIEKSKSPERSIDDILEKSGAEKAEKNEIELVVKKIVENNKALIKEQGMRALGPLMGDAMKELKGKAAGNEISEALKKELTKATKNA